MENRWTREHVREASKEFWGIAKISTGYIPYAFLNSGRTSYAVIELIQRRAKEGSKLHQRALALLTLQK